MTHLPVAVYVLEARLDEEIEKGNIARCYKLAYRLRRILEKALENARSIEEDMAAKERLAAINDYIAICLN